MMPVLCAWSLGCLGPLESDQPGYSRHILPAGSHAPSARDDYEANRKVDMNDGLSAGEPELKAGFAQGVSVNYWDLGLAKGSIAPAYYLTRCDRDHVPQEGGALEHPWIWDSAPGDPDYTPYRALYPVCITEDYDGELIPSGEALSDAIDMQLVREPNAPSRWLNLPVIAAGVVPNSGVVARPALIAGRLYECLSFEQQEGHLTFVEKRIAAKNVYELSFPGNDRVERVVFAQGLLDENGQRNPSYAPAWKVVAVKVAAETDLTPFDRESTLVTVDEKGGVKPAAEQVLSAKPTGDVVNRPHQAPPLEALP